MKKFIILFCILLVVLMFASCAANSHTIIYNGNEILDCPSSAVAGEKVTLNVPMISDGDLVVSINGDISYGEYNNSGQYEFIMPDEDVEIVLKIDTSGYNV